MAIVLLSRPWTALKQQFGFCQLSMTLAFCFRVNLLWQTTAPLGPVIFFTLGDKNTGAQFVNCRLDYCNRMQDI